MATVANIYLEESADTSGTAFSIANNDTMIAGGATDSDYISIASGVTGTVVASTIEDVTLSGAIGDYKFKQGFGSNLEIYNSSDVLVATITDVDGKNLTFSDSATTALVYNETTGSMSVGGSNISSTTAAALGATVDTTTAVAADLIAEDAAETLTLNATASTITGNIADITTVVGAAGITTATDVALTVSDATSVAEANVLDNATSGVITADIEETDIATLKTVTDANGNNVYTATVNSISVDATDLIAANTAIVNLTVDSAVATVTEDTIGTSAANVTDALALTGSDGTQTTAVTITGAISVADANIIDAATDGIVTASVSETDASTLATVADSNANNVIAATLNDITVDATDLVALDAALTLTVDSAVVTVTEAAANLTATTAAEMTNALALTNNAAATITDAISIAQYDNIDDATTGIVTATVEALTDTTDTFVFNNNILTITNDFLNGTDKLSFVGAGSVAQEGTLTAVAVTNNTGDSSFTLDANNTSIYVIDTDVSDLNGSGTTADTIDFSDATLGEVAAFLNTGVTANDTEGEMHFFVINDGDVSTAAYVYEFVQNSASNTTIEAGELTLIGTVTTNDAATTVDSIAIA